MTPIGRFVLNRNVDNFFAETEQVAFCPGHIVPGIDFTNDPLLQARLFSYTDTQLSRLGGPNFHQIPINKPVCPFHNNQRDGIHQHTIHKGQASYQPNSIDNDWPAETPPAASNGGFESYPEQISGHKLRQRSETFSDHFSQPRLYYKSLAPHEQKHVVDAYTFELSKVQRKHIRERQVQQILANIDLDLARQVGANLGIEVPDLTLDYKKTAVEKSAKLSFLAFPPQDIQGRKVAVLIHNLVKSDALEAMKNWAIKEGVTLHLLAPSLAPVKDHQDSIITADGMQMAEPSIAYDAVIIPDGDNLNAVMQDGVTRHYLLEAYKHLKPIAFLGNKSDLLEPLGLVPDEGTLVGDEFQPIAEKFKNLIMAHRVWSREPIAAHIPA